MLNNSFKLLRLVALRRCELRRCGVSSGMVRFVGVG